LQYAPVRFVAALIMATASLIPGRATAQLDQSRIATYGEWQFIGEVGADGRIDYRATLHDHADPRRTVQIKCWPSAPERGFTFFLFDEAIKDAKSKPVLVTFNNSRLATVDQFEGGCERGLCGRHAFALGTCWMRSLQSPDWPAPGSALDFRPRSKDGI
jgi:hypothetical protein